MKPYLVHKTWIDLDHVVAIDGDSLSPSCGGSDHVRVEFLFKNSPVFIDVGPIPGARKILDDLIAAWKAKDEPNVHVVKSVDDIIDDWLAKKKFEIGGQQ